MTIIISKRKGSICGACHNKINGKYKVKVSGDRYYHLSCYFNYLKRRIVNVKEEIKEFSKLKYKKQMILERLHS